MASLHNRGNGVFGTSQESFGQTSVAEPVSANATFATRLLSPDSDQTAGFAERLKRARLETVTFPWAG